MKDEVSEKIIPKFEAVRPKTYAVKIQKDEYGNKNKDFKKAKKSISKDISGFGNFQKCVNDIKNTPMIKGQANSRKENTKYFL